MDRIAFAPLDPSRHRSTRVGAFPDFAHARQQQHGILGLNEIALAAADYPLVLMKHAETGQFNVAALYGFAPGQNFFITGSHWSATYIPQNTLRHPFLASDSGVLGLAIDERSELIGTPQGERLFNNAGAPTDYTLQIAKALHWLKKDFEAMQEFVQTLTQRSLVQPLSLLLRMEDGTQSLIEGLYGISTETLNALPDDDIITLHRRGFLREVSVLMTSLVQLNRLQQLHNAQSSPHIVDIALKL